MTPSATRFLEADEVHHDDNIPWGLAMLGASIVFLLTFAGLFVVVANNGFSRVKTLPKTLTKLIIPSFASGALLATSILLLIPESIELLSSPGNKVGEGHRFLAETHHDHHDDDHDDHDDHSFAWKVGTAFLCGFVLPLILHAFFPHPCEEDQEQLPHELEAKISDLSLKEDVGAKDTEADAEGNANNDGEVTFPGECDTGDCCHKDNEECGVPQNVHNWPLVMSIMVSDFLCNFADGVFIGSGFLLCSKQVAYGIVASTVYHELAQEIADFVLLTHTCKFSIPSALLLNAVHGTGVFWGVILILAAEPSQASIGLLLAFSAGVFVNITSAECIPKIQSQLHKSFRNTAVFLTCFTIGAVPLGLVLLDHGHCVADDHDDHRV